MPQGAPDAGAEPARDPHYRPAWFRFAPFLGRPPPLTRRQWRVLGLLSLVSLFEQYDIYLFALNLSRIQRELGIGESQLGLLGGLVRAGAFGALLVTLAADRIGRRRVLYFTVLAYTLLTGATAFAPSIEWFVALQVLARAFTAAESLIAVVVIAEEFDAEHRGWGIGALAGISASGAGLAAAMFSLVDVLPGGWRALYLVGLAPLLTVAWWRRTMPESARFAALAQERAGTPRAARPQRGIAALFRTQPLRAGALAGVMLAFGVAISPALFFSPKYLEDMCGWTPGDVALLNVVGGAFAVVGNPLAGWLSDRHGRRPVALVFVLATAACAIAFYSVAGPAAGLLWIALVFAEMGCEVMVAAYGAEMFPTAQRATASGVRSFANTLGMVLGLVAVSGLFALLGSNWSAVRVLATATFAMAAIIYFAFPETSGRSLEEIAPDPE